QVARAKAEDMAARNYSGHTNPDGFGPNYLVRQAGYVLPSYYGTGAADNQIEMNMNGSPTPEITFQVWMNSPDHRRQLLGEGAYATQTNYGIGFAPNGGRWVVLTAPPAP